MDLDIKATTGQQDDTNVSVHICCKQEQSHCAHMQLRAAEPVNLFSGLRILPQADPPYALLFHTLTRQSRAKPAPASNVGLQHDVGLQHLAVWLVWPVCLGNCK